MWTEWPTEEAAAMANITAKQVLEQVDALVPNQYTRAEKLRWLAQAEGFVLREICRVTGPLAALEEDAALAVEAMTSCTATMWRRRSTTATARWPGTTARQPTGTTAC